MNKIPTFSSSFFAAIFLLSTITSCAQQPLQTPPPTFRNYQQNKVLTPFRLPPATSGFKYEDLDKDGDPDLLKYQVANKYNVIWIDDDDDMKRGDHEGDMDSDCLLIDLNNDGKFGSEKDLNIDWGDEDGDGKADMQCIVDNGLKTEKGKWQSHYIWFFDNDKDGVMGYINWDKFSFEGWDHDGRANFFTDYNGQSTMLKVHITTWNMKDLEYNWENPFLYFDEDNDGLSEMAMRLVDEPVEVPASEDDPLLAWQFSHKISYVQIGIDLDNDSRPGNELDYDMSLKFMGGEGFDYADQAHFYKNISGLEDADFLFDDPRWRHTSKLVFADHETAYNLTFNRGKWGACWFVFDEDDDCQRWERVEFYDPKDPFKIGAKNGGLDHNPQADATGDRAEWDMDFSGKGQLYISPLDGRLHLLGAEKGYWRIDQAAVYFQGWQGWRGPNLQPEDFVRTEPTTFGTMMYEDTDNNGFMDRLSMDLDGDQKFEQTISLAELGISDEAAVIDTKNLDYEGYTKIYDEMAAKMWKNATQALKFAEQTGINTAWYSHLMHPKSLREEYHNGYFLMLYLYLDLTDMATKNKDLDLLKKIKKAYFSEDWRL
ncbi:MAG TPA: hypothetical protein ENJ95_10040 [Bacteroidetes bacterium]|nr:hypothetical protein [Bacteroidota bacterium]